MESNKLDGGWGRSVLRSASGVAVLATALSLSFSAVAQDYPNAPIRIVVPYTAGGVTDVVVRQMARLLEDDFKQPVVVENKSGANGTLGATQLITAKPDGYLLSIVPIGIFRQPLIEKMSLQPMKHLTYIASLVDYSYVISVKNDAPWKTPADLIAAMKTTDRCTYGTPGVYSTPHIAMEDFSNAAGFKCLHVPYKGAADATSALAGGEIDLLVSSGGGSLDGLVASKRLRMLATLGESRSPTYPQVPTLKESGVHVVAVAPFGLVGPAGMDPKIVERLAQAVRKTLNSSTMHELVQRNSAVVQYMGPQDYRAYAERTWQAEQRRFAATANK